MEYGLSVVEGSSVTYPACVGRILCVDMVFESCLKMLVTWIDCHGRIECVTNPVCMGVFYVFDMVFESCLKMLPGDMD